MSDVGDVAATVTAAFQRVLGRAAVAPADDFFALGGDQMAATRVLGLLDDAFEVAIDLAAFAAAPTIAGTTDLVDERRRRTKPPPRREAPVAFSQEGMVWQEQFVPGSQNLPPLVRRFLGPLAVEALEAALDEIVRRHEPLRSRFDVRGGRPLQVVAAHDRLVLPVHDLGGMSDGDRQEALGAALVRAGRPFDLSVGPLFEPTLIRFGPDDHVMVLRVHHSVFDDWSVGVFRRELSVLYTAFAAGDASPLPELAMGFAEFSRRQRRRLAGAAGTDQLSWWKDRLAGAPWCLQLPIGDPARAEGAPQPSAAPVVVEVPPTLYDAVRALARRQRATPFMTVLAAFSALVGRYTGQSDLLMATVVANRNRPQLEPMIGCLTKKVLLRQDLGGDPTFTEVVSRTREAVLGMLPNQDLAFETVLQETVGAAAADHGLVPSVAVMFQGVTPQRDEVALRGVASSGYETSTTTTRTHFSAGAGDGAGDEAPPPWGQGLYAGTFLIVSLEERAAGATLTARGAFDGPATERLLANLVATLAEIVADPSRPLPELAMLDDAQRRQLDGCNGTAAAFPVEQCAHQVFEARAALVPSAVAVRTETTEVTFAELDARAGALAAGLAASGVGRGSLVGLCLDAPEDSVAAVLAIWKAGAGYVALRPDDDRDHLARVIEDASVEVVVGRSAAVEGRFPPQVRVVDVDGHPAGEATSAVPEASAEPGDVATVFYGAGRSRVERAVVLDHSSVVNLVEGLRRDVWPGTARLRVCLSAPPTGDAFARQLAALLAGHTLRVAGGGPKGAVSLLAGGEVDVIDADADADAGGLAGLVAAGIDDMVAAGGDVDDLPTLVVGTRRGLDGGAWRRLRRLPGARAVVVFGPPECGFGAAAASVAAGGVRAVIGRPMANVTAHVVSAEGAAVPVQVTGLLRIDGPDRRSFDTGLRVRFLPDGTIEVLGPVADVVDLGGFTVDRARIEAVLRRAPGVGDVRIEVGTDGSGGPRLSARVVADGDTAPPLDRLHELLWSELPGYAWPAEVRVDGRLVHPARSPEEEGLASSWAGVVGADHVDGAENYWQSFSFLDALTRARAAGLRVGVEQVTRNRTIATLGADVAAGRRPRPGSA